MATLSNLNPTKTYLLTCDTEGPSPVWWAVETNDAHRYPFLAPEFEIVDEQPDAAREHQVLTELVQHMRAGNTAAVVELVRRLAAGS